MRYKLLILDIDGTLVKSKNSRVPLHVAKAVQKIIGKINIALCTGRSLKYVRHVIKSLGLRGGYHVLESGAKVLNPQGKYERVKTLSAQEIDELVKMAKDAPATKWICAEGDWTEDIDKGKHQQVTTVSFQSVNQAQTKAIVKNLKPIWHKYNIAIGSHWEVPAGSSVLITTKGVSKGEAIEHVQIKLNVNISDTIGVGDMPNDLPIFARSGLKIAMGNAHPGLKTKADYIAPSIEDDGVVKIVNDLLKNRL